GPVVPVLALTVSVVLRVVGLHEPLWVTPYGLENARPGVANADVAGSAAAGRDRIALLVVDHGEHAKHPRTAASGLHRLEGGERAAEEPAVLGLPPGVDDDRLALAHDVEVPAPDFGLDGLTNGGHVLEVIVVLAGL